MKMESIESKYEIVYPKIYRNLNKDGMLNWGEFGQEWINNVYPKLKELPPFLLYANDFELIDNGRISEEIEGFKDPEDYRQTNPKFNFVPFAQTEAGDLYCFQFDNIKDNNIPIVLVWHDMNSVSVLAKNLQDFIFRSMAETLIDFEQEYSLLSEGNVYENLQNYFQTHSKYLSHEQKVIIEKWYRLIIVEQRNTDKILSDKEIEKLISEMKENIAFIDLEKEFKYQNE